MNNTPERKSTLQVNSNPTPVEPKTYEQLLDEVRLLQDQLEVTNKHVEILQSRIDVANKTCKLQEDQYQDLSRKYKEAVDIINEREREASLVRKEARQTLNDISLILNAAGIVRDSVPEMILDGVKKLYELQLEDIKRRRSAEKERDAVRQAMEISSARREVELEEAIRNMVNSWRDTMRVRHFPQRHDDWYIPFNTHIERLASLVGLPGDNQSDIAFTPFMLPSETRKKCRIDREFLEKSPISREDREMAVISILIDIREQLEGRHCNVQD